MELFRHTDSELLDLVVDSETISVTPDHEFWVVDKGWVKAEDLVVGSLLTTEDGRVVDVDGITKREGDFQVYNFEVEGFHTYFISELGVLVHNACTGFSNRTEQALTSYENLKNNVLGDINSQSNHNHYNAARREAAGEVVAYRPDGTPFNHIGELQDAYRGLQNIRRSLEVERNNLSPNITDRGIEVLNKKYTEVQGDLGRLKGFLNSIGHSP